MNQAKKLLYRTWIYIFISGFATTMFLQELLYLNIFYALFFGTIALIYFLLAKRQVKQYYG